MNRIVVTAGKAIARPIEVVRAQLVDMQHHMTARVHASLKIEMPVSGLMCLLAPLIRSKLLRDTEPSLEEDRLALEERRYTPAG